MINRLREFKEALTLEFFQIAHRMRQRFQLVIIEEEPIEEAMRIEIRYQNECSTYPS